MQFALPSASYGYYRGAPQYGGVGSGNGPSVQGNGAYAQGQGAAGTGSGSWNPTILYLFFLVFAEMFVFAFLSRHI